MIKNITFKTICMVFFIIGGVLTLAADAYDIDFAKQKIDYTPVEYWWSQAIFWSWMGALLCFVGYAVTSIGDDEEDEYFEVERVEK